MASLVDRFRPTAQQRYYEQLSVAAACRDLAAAARLRWVGPPPAERGDGFLGHLAYLNAHPQPTEGLSPWL